VAAASSDVRLLQPASIAALSVVDGTLLLADGTHRFGRVNVTRGSIGAVDSARPPRVLLGHVTALSSSPGQPLQWKDVRAEVNGSLASFDSGTLYFGLRSRLRVRESVRCGAGLQVQLSSSNLQLDAAPGTPIESALCKLNSLTLAGSANVSGHVFVDASNGMFSAVSSSNVLGLVAPVDVTIGTGGISCVSSPLSVPCPPSPFGDAFAADSGWPAVLLVVPDVQPG
jgi:hypothetical protein